MAAREGIEPSTVDSEGVSLEGDCKTGVTTNSQPDAQEKGNAVLRNGALLADLFRTWDKYSVELKQQILVVLETGGQTS
jgi:hypothetical protein